MNSGGHPTKAVSKPHMFFQGYQFPTVMGYQGVSVAAAAAGVTTLLNPLDPSVPPPTQPPDPTLPPETPGMDQSAQDLDKKKKKKLEPLTVEDLLNIPLPKEEAKPKKKAMKKEEEVVEGGEQTEERVEFSEGDIMQVSFGLVCKLGLCV